MHTVQVEWRSLAAQAMLTHDGFETLLSELEPLIKQMAVIYCPGDPEGSAQEARAHLFRIVHEQKRVDLKRADISVGKFLSGLLRNQIRHEARRVSRKGMNCMGKSKTMRHDRPEILPIIHASHRMAPSHTPSDMPFPIPQYAQYFAIHRTTTGAAEEIAAQFGMDAGKLEKLFYRVAKTIRH